MADAKKDVPGPITAQMRYSQLEDQRNVALERARDAAKLTIPALMPPMGASDATRLPTPFQSVGARGINNLASKLLLALFPPGSSFFRLTVDEFVMDKLKERAQANGSDDPTEAVEAALNKMEKAITTRLEAKTVRPVLNEAFKHLPNDGNVLLLVKPDGGLKLWTLDKYVVKRDGEGNPLEIIAKECLSRKSLSKEAAAIVAANPANDQQAGEDEDDIDVYTWVARKSDGSWRVHQEVANVEIPSTRGFYPKDQCAFLALRWERVSGNDYGRGYVEQYIGDLLSFESMSQSIVEFAANAAKVLWFTDEGGTTDKKAVADAANGAVLSGNAKDISVLQMQKFADFQVVKGTADDIRLRLEQAFLLTSSIQRNAERVTAEEIRIMAGELENGLGGTYSLFAQELQLPLVTRLMAVMAKTGDLPQLPQKVVTPTIITGLDGLGRTSDLQKLDQLFTSVSQIVSPQALAEYITVGALIERFATALGVDVSGVTKSEQEVQQARQDAQQAALAQKVGGPAIKAMSDQAIAARQTQQQPDEAAASQQ